MRKPVAPTTQRGARTRQHIKEVAIRLLEQMGYRNLRVSDIVREGNVNVSLIYHYFRGKEDITFEILSELMDEQSNRSRIKVTSEAPFERLLELNRVVIDWYADTPGLMRCLTQFNEDTPEFSEIFREASVKHCRRIARDIAGRFPEASLGHGDRMAIAYVLGGMVDSFLSEVYILRNPELIEEFSDRAKVARFLAIMWYRALFLENPSDKDLGDFNSFKKLSGVFTRMET